MRKLAVFLILISPAWATSYFVIQAGAGSGNGSSLGNAASMATYNANTMVGSPTGGDTVFFSGSSITTRPLIPTSGTSAVSRLTLDFSGVGTINCAYPCINLNNQNYLNVLGGGTFSGGTFTQACVLVSGMTAGSGSGLISGGGTGSAGGCDNVTISGFYYLGAAGGGGAFIIGYPFTNLLVQSNDIENAGNFYYSDRNLSHDLTFSNNRFYSAPSNTTDQCDGFQILDAYNVTIQGNDIYMQTPGAVGPRHNDAIQSGKSGAGGGQAAFVAGWIVRYNRINCNIPATGGGNTSWTQFESLGNGAAGFGLKCYANVWIGTANNNDLTNGVTVYNEESSATLFYIYNNTFARHDGPDNTVRFLNSATAYYTNNIMQADAAGAGTYISSVVTAGAAFDYNYFRLCDSPSSTYTGTHGAANTDPLFTNYATNDFSLQSGSPCKFTGDSTIGAEYNQGIAAGATWPNPALISRAGGAWSIGAFEFGGGVASYSSSLSGKVLLSGKVQIK